MKIIFDSEEQKEDFMADVCPDDVSIALHAELSDRCYGPCCSECWKNCGIELEVKQ